MPEFMDALNRPYADYDCTNCGSAVVERHGFLEDECQGCGQRFPTKNFKPAGAKRIVVSPEVERDLRSWRFR